MSRCVACNRPLEHGALSSLDPLTGLPEDMCTICREKSRSEYNIMFDHEYEQQNVTEGLTTNSRVGYYYDFFDN